MTSNPKPSVSRTLTVKLLVTAFAFTGMISDRVLASDNALNCNLESIGGCPSRTAENAATPSLDYDRGQERYVAGQFAAAVEAWEQAISLVPERSLPQASLLINLALGYKQLGQWTDAQTSLEKSLGILTAMDPSPLVIPTLAQAWNSQGNFYFDRGQFNEALEAFKRAETFYRQLPIGAAQTTGVVRSQINQALALQALGFYQSALKQLEPLQKQLETEPNPSLGAAGLRILGETLETIGNTTEAETQLQKSLERSQQSGIATEISASQFSLATLWHKRRQGLDPQDASASEAYTKAVTYYQDAAEQAVNPVAEAQILVNWFRLTVELGLPEPELQDRTAKVLHSLAPSRSSINNRIHFATSLLKQQQNNSRSKSLSLADLKDVRNWLVEAVQQSRELRDQRTEAYALGRLGHLSELTQHWKEAQQLTETALDLAQRSRADDISYQWQWQLGRLLQAQNKPDEALIAYMAAIDTLKGLRGDIVSLSPETRFNFRETTEPLYRETVSLWLETAEHTQDVSQKQKQLEEARKLIESLQVAELANFFRADCVGGLQTSVDQTLRTNEALVYPILLDDRLEILVSRPGHPLEQYHSAVDRADLEKTIENLRIALAQRPTPEPARGDSTSTPLQRIDPQPLTIQLYQWLIQPLETTLADTHTDTLIFVLDGALRNIPMSTLYDGQQYLIEKYAVAITPGLELIDPKPLTSKRVEAVVGALSEARQEFSAIPAVKAEVTEIQSQVHTVTLLNEQFQKVPFQDTVNRVPFPIVHLATHGKFSSNAEDTFILTWDDRLNVNELSSLLQNSELTRKQPIELLILSACETAAGDDRAALGLAGVAVRAGARSTIASLWVVDDVATSILMNRLYGEISIPQQTKAQSLRQAQLNLLHNPQYANPYYWAPFVLVGNWL